MTNKKRLMNFARVWLIPLGILAFLLYDSAYLKPVRDYYRNECSKIGGQQTSWDDRKCSITTVIILPPQLH